MDKKLNLAKLFDEDFTLKNNIDRDYEINKRFIELFPKPFWERGIIFKKYKYPHFTRKQIKEIIVDNGLVAEGAEPEDATNEALKKGYCFNAVGSFYNFIELKDRNGNMVYEFRQVLSKF
ncbi:hypothetical protein COU53_03655 [Candidatus Pacearchaeota archaeon CG10_big_fil_rev_8_21_14_0_10_30_48]|nr:MAG: hypothetical protein COU53_03655 [Candidatus Pacearchaeota archaeon CG10_big_fil_rev_8_21_14_0_10_30_48]